MNAPHLTSTAAAAVTFASSGSMEVLNSECFCISLDTSALREALESEIGEPGLFDLIQQRCPYLFATRPVSSESIVNETCGLVFDGQGAVDSHAAHAIDGVAAPTEAQWATLRALVFSNAAATPNEGDTP